MLTLLQYWAHTASSNRSASIGFATEIIIGWWRSGSLSSFTSWSPTPHCPECLQRKTSRKWNWRLRHPHLRPVNKWFSFLCMVCESACSDPGIRASLQSCCWFVCSVFERGAVRLACSNWSSQFLLRPTYHDFAAPSIMDLCFCFKRRISWRHWDEQYYLFFLNFQEERTEGGE